MKLIIFFTILFFNFVLIFSKYNILDEDNYQNILNNEDEEIEEIILDPLSDEANDLAEEILLELKYMTDPLGFLKNDLFVEENEEDIEEDNEEYDEEEIVEDDYEDIEDYDSINTYLLSNNMKNYMKNNENFSYKSIKLNKILKFNNYKTKNYNNYYIILSVSNENFLINNANFLYCIVMQRFYDNEKFLLIKKLPKLNIKKNKIDKEINNFNNIKYLKELAWKKYF